MATTLLGENPVQTVGDLPAPGSHAPSYTLTGADLVDFTSDAQSGSRVVLNIFPSIDTGVCAASVRRFNELAAGLDNTVVVCASADLMHPFDPARDGRGEFIAQSGTLNGNPIAAVAGLATLAELRKPGAYETFADGFAGVKEVREDGDAKYRPMGLAEGPDGSLYIGDTQHGRIWKVVYVGQH